MLAKTHVAFGILFSLFFIPILTTGNKFLFFFLVILGSLLPDLDTPKSTLGSKVKFFSWFMQKTLGHRGLFHSLLFSIAVHTLIWIFIGKIYRIALFIGYVSHILIDGFTKEGINFLHPIGRLHLIGFVKTGGYIEFVLFLAFIVLIIVKIIVF